MITRVQLENVCSPPDCKRATIPSQFHPSLALDTPRFQPLLTLVAVVLALVWGLVAPSRVFAVLLSVLRSSPYVYIRIYGHGPSSVLATDSSGTRETIDITINVLTRVLKNLREKKEFDSGPTYWNFFYQSKLIFIYVKIIIEAIKYK